MAKASRKSSRRPLERKVAIVTGSGRGIGRAIAETLAKEGANVTVTARTKKEIAETAERIRSRGDKAIAVVADVSNQASVQRLVKETERRLGPADILVNNAGHAGVFAPLWECDPEEWWRTLEVNVLGPMLCSQAVLPSMISRRQGVIVNIGEDQFVRTRPAPEEGEVRPNRARGPLRNGRLHTDLRIGTGPPKDYLLAGLDRVDELLRELKAGKKK